MVDGVLEEIRVGMEVFSRVVSCMFLGVLSYTHKYTRTLYIFSLDQRSQDESKSYKLREIPRRVV